MEREFIASRIPFSRESPIQIEYRGRPLQTTYRADFVCYDQILVELKAIQCLTGVEESQVINYLKATGLQKAILFNFGAPSMEFRRLVFHERRKAASLHHDQQK